MHFLSKCENISTKKQTHYCYLTHQFKKSKSSSKFSCNICTEGVKKSRTSILYNTRSFGRIRCLSSFFQQQQAKYTCLIYIVDVKFKKYEFLRLQSSLQAAPVRIPHRAAPSLPPQFLSLTLLCFPLKKMKKPQKYTLKN